MSLIEVAVDGLGLVDDNPANTTTVMVNPACLPSLKSKAEGKGIYKEKLDFIIMSGSGISPSCVLVAPVMDSIDPTAMKDKADGELVMRKGDMVTVNANGQAPNGDSCPLVFIIKIDDAGQTKVKGQ